MTSTIYHLFNKSIAGFSIFNRGQDFERMQMLLKFYQAKPSQISFYRFLKTHEKSPISALAKQPINKNASVSILAYCLMPTHFHIAAEADSKESLSKFLNDVLNSYTRYFNLLRNRKDRFGKAVVKKSYVKVMNNFFISPATFI